MGIKDKNIFDKIRRNNPYFEDFITRSIYNSNAIEGNTISYAETYAIVFNQNDMKVTAQPREIYEAINLKYAMNSILKTLDEEITAEYMKKIAILINKNIDEIDGFRKEKVFIKGAEHIPPEPAYVPMMVQELLYDYRKNTSDDIFHKLAEFHLRFERIHPFKDGNGRTGRVLLAKEFMRNGYPPLIITIEDRAKYMNLLAAQDVDGLSAFMKERVTFESKRMKDFGIIIEDENPSPAQKTIVNREIKGPKL